MKNYWLNNIFPKDDKFMELRSIDLSPYYANQYVHKEKVSLIEIQEMGNQPWLMGSLSCIPLPGTVVIHIGEKEFLCATENGDFIKKDFSHAFGNVCHKSGLLAFSFGKIDNEILVSYECEVKS